VCVFLYTPWLCVDNRFVNGNYWSKREALQNYNIFPACYDLFVSVVYNNTAGIFYKPSLSTLERERELLSINFLEALKVQPVASSSLQYVVDKSTS
jgi:hypothetical protein